MDYKETPREELEPGYQHGHTYTSIVINAPMYLEYLFQTARQLGVQAISAQLPSSSNLAESLQAATKIVAAHFDGHGESQISAFVNATGISALNFVPDSGIYPVRGQTVTVKGEANQITTIEAYSNPDGSGTPIMYVLPRPHSNTTILGGTKDVGDWSAEPNPSTTEEILRRAKQWAPELLNEAGNFEVLSVQVGLRPARKGGVRVEVEKVDDFLVCHAYGHAGAGYQNSVGSANKVVRLLQESLGDTAVSE
jgi:D-amino-acid oxidase